MQGRNISVASSDIDSVQARANECMEEIGTGQTGDTCFWEGFPVQRPQYGGTRDHTHKEGGMSRWTGIGRETEPHKPCKRRYLMEDI